MKNIVHRTPDSKGNIPPPVDVIKMAGQKEHIDFKEPDNYYVGHPKVTIDDCQYELYKKGSLSFATPKLLTEVVHRLRLQKS